MSSFEAWLAAMPIADVQQRKGELDRQISELQAERADLEVLERRHAARAPSRNVTPATADGAGASRALAALGDTLALLKGQISPERQAIIDIVRECGGSASPQQVTDALIQRGKETNPAAVQTNMSRMVKNRMLARGDRRGLYTLPSDTPSDPERLALAGTEPSNGNGAVTDS